MNVAISQNLFISDIRENDININNTILWTSSELTAENTSVLKYSR